MDQRLRETWRERERAFPIYPALHLAPEGQVLGAGTVLVPAHEARRLASLDGQEARVLALLSAAYGKAVAPAVLGNIARAADAWRQGDDCLAYIHLAHSRLPGAGHEQTVLLRGPMSSPPVALHRTAEKAPSAGWVRGQ
jgi:hypothetical protein